jgi:hypothetical protein
VKYGFVSVLASIDVHCSGQSLSIQADIAYNCLKSQAEKDQCKRSIWLSNLDLTSRLTTQGAGLCKAEWNRRNDYCSLFDSKKSQFRLIVMDVSNNEDIGRTTKCSFLTTFALKFHHVRTVHLVTQDGKRWLQCSCFYPECVGVPCHRQLHIPKLEDAHPYWWLLCLLHAYKHDEKGGRTPLAKKNLEEIAATFEKRPYLGPMPPFDGPNLLEPKNLLPHDNQHFEQKPVEDRVTNWTIGDLKKILPNCWKPKVRQEGTCQVETSQPIPGLSPQSFNFNQDDDFSSDTDNEEMWPTAWST